MTINNSDWIADIQHLITQSKSILFSLESLEKELKKLITSVHSPLCGISISCEARGNKIISTNVIGKTTTKEPRVYNDHIGKSDLSVDVRIEYWEQSPVKGNLFSHFSTLLENIIIPSARVSGHGILDAKYFEVRERLTPTLKYLLSEHTDYPPQIVYIDLDNFGTLNNDNDHEVADTALRFFAAHLEEAAATVGGVALKYGGDEYAMIAAGYPSSALVEALDNLRGKVAAQLFGVKGFQIKFACGILAIDPAEPNYDFFELLPRAEGATKKPGTDSSTDQKRRGEIGFADDVVCEEGGIGAEEFIKFGLALSRSRLGSPAPFSNIILNVVSAKTFRLARQNGGGGLQELEDLLTWFGVRYTENYSPQHLIDRSTIAASQVPIGAIALAVFHGYYRYLALNGESDPTVALTVDISTDGASARVLNDKGVKLWGRDAVCERSIGGGPSMTFEEKEGPLPSKLPAVVIVQIGLGNELLRFGSQTMPSDLFADVVVVDDRPNFGGGLPDFWQAALTHVAEALCRYPSVNEIIVLGKETNAQETVGRLRGSIDWDSSEAVDLTKFPRSLVVERTKLFGTEHVRVINDRTEFVNALYDYSVGLSVWKTAAPISIPAGKSRLARKVQTDGFQLDLMQGIKCATAADAYPMIIEIMRNADDSFVTYDDAQQEMYETKGFKLTLENPYADPIPEYFIGQKGTLDQYVRGVLIEIDSKIGSHLYEDGQFDAFIRHLASYCNEDHREASTRRAILVVKNGLTEEGELRPLGLVCVWATPKRQGLQTVIEFCFVWRTVEALVGLPYSLYGSISFAQKIADDVVAYIKESRGDDVRVEPGSLTYLALSLHMRVDDFHRRIAKRIVDGSSQ